MCDVQTKLVAWLDGELSAEEAAGVGHHIGTCPECRSRLETYKRLSESLAVYCDAVVAAKTRRRVPRLVPVLAGTAVAAVIALLAFPRLRVEPPPILAPPIAAVPFPNPAPPATDAAPRKNIHKRRAVPAVQRQAANWQPTEHSVQIAIPAEAMFPPGAVPKGMNFIAELRIAQDGSVQQVRLQQ